LTFKTVMTLVLVASVWVSVTMKVNEYTPASLNVGVQVNNPVVVLNV